ncbi:histidine--tRNA ligase [Leptospira ryugenii]|uniref:Histidine--tRNA ligase n=1 Tax=Leptospira ryugenii TaxID=1917863 RepID=A0A2P2DWB0_9LEPT|nr:ATP phosphoribosyltransferase regulatory subunit [Leptospira ryugenii]GBF48913.1 histidine--tRNA ligase [Leptospira ryugenii]
MNSIKKSKLAERRWIPDGFHFLGPEESKRRRELLQRLSQCLEEASYSEIYLPAFDYTSSFQSQISGTDTSAFLATKDFDGYSLSPGVDLTLQVVKGMAARSHWKENQNVYYIGRRIRDHKKKNASRREILQIGGESIGDSSLPKVFSQMELLSKMWQKVLPKVPATLVLGHAAFLSELFTWLKVPNHEEGKLAQILFTKNAPELQKYLKLWNVSDERQKFLKLCLKPTPFAEFSQFKEKLLSFQQASFSLEAFVPYLEEIESIIQLWSKAHPSFDGIFDATLIRDLDYYTGIVFQGYMEGYSEPVFAGGVYNQLYESYTEVKKNACGFALHVDPIEEKLETRG